MIIDKDDRCIHQKGECFSCVLWDSCERAQKERGRVPISLILGLLGFFGWLLWLIFG